MHLVGILPDEICNRNKCDGILISYTPFEGCTCHCGHPPCYYCVSMRGYCPVCEWNSPDNMNKRKILFEKMKHFYKNK